VAAGALTGALLSARRVGIGLRTPIIGAIALGAIQAAAGFMPAIAPFAALIVVAGAASLLFLTAANSLVQMSSNLSVRGRVMALYILVQLGGQAIGGPVMGWIVEQFGPHVGMIVSGLVPLVVASIVALVLARRRNLALVVRPRGPFVHIVPRA
jgi:MFS family permease